MLEGETTVKNIFTGKDFEDPVPPTVIDEVAYMEEIPFMDPAAGYTVDKAIVSSESGIKMDGGKAGITIPTTLISRPWQIPMSWAATTPCM